MRLRISQSGTRFDSSMRIENEEVAPSAGGGAAAAGEALGEPGDGEGARFAVMVVGVAVGSVSVAGRRWSDGARPGPRQVWPGVGVGILAAARTSSGRNTR